MVPYIPVARNVTRSWAQSGRSDYARGGACAESRHAGIARSGPVVRSRSRSTRRYLSWGVLRSERTFRQSSSSRVSSS
jgi:hypothetical protein